MKIPLLRTINKIRALIHKWNEDPIYNFATVFDYAEGRYEVMSAYRNINQVLTLIEEVISGKMNGTIILVCWSGGGEVLGVPEFGDVCVCWNRGYESFKWKDGSKTLFKDAFEKACTFIKTGKKPR